MARVRDWVFGGRALHLSEVGRIVRRGGIEK